MKYSFLTPHDMGVLSVIFFYPQSLGCSVVQPQLPYWDIRVSQTFLVVFKSHITDKISRIGHKLQQIISMKISLNLMCAGKYSKIESNLSKLDTEGIFEHVTVHVWSLAGQTSADFYGILASWMVGRFGGKVGRFRTRIHTLKSEY